jgi:hypothetical protein
MIYRKVIATFHSVSGLKNDSNGSYMMSGNVCIVWCHLQHVALEMEWIFSQPTIPNHFPALGFICMTNIFIHSTFGS